MKDSPKPTKKNKKSNRLIATLASLLFFLSPFLIAGFLLIIKKADSDVRLQTKLVKILPSPVSLAGIAGYPVLTNVLGANTISSENETLSAQAAIVVDSASGVVLYAKNPNLRFSMASTAKIMTALIGIEYYKMDDVLTIFSTNVVETKVGFLQGERVSFKDLLYGMLLPSGNDAALAISQNYKEGEDAFVAGMNEKAKEFSLFNTHFADPIGLSENDYTTAADLATLSSLAMRNSTFAEIVKTKYAFITNVDKTRSYQLENIDKLLGMDGVDGIKTGHTDQAGDVLATSTVENGHRYILVILKSEDRFVDMANLLSLIKGNVRYTDFIR